MNTKYPSANIWQDRYLHSNPHSVIPNLYSITYSCRLYMWIAVLLVLLITGAIFYGLAKYYESLLKMKDDDVIKSRSGKELEVYKNNADLYEGWYLRM